MASKDEERDDDVSEPEGSESEALVPSQGQDLSAAAEGDYLDTEGLAVGEPGDGDAVVATTSLGAARYVHAAFACVGLLTAYIAGKMLGAAWSHLAEWPAAVRVVPQLLSYSEEDRGSFTLVGGALLGLAIVVYVYLRPDVRQWADDVAEELSKVAWPTRDTVTTGTIVVVVASLIATVYVTLLDRFWSFVTDLVYQA